jgi:hypothetical protein
VLGRRTLLRALERHVRPLAGTAWRSYSSGFNARAARRYLQRERFGDPLAFPLPPIADSRFAAGVREYTENRRVGVPFREWVYDLREPCYVEPSRGLVLGPRGEWLVDPIGYYQLVSEPPYKSLVSLIRRGNAVRTLDSAVSLRCFTEGNYWHFYADLLSKLQLVDELDLPRSVPLLVGERLWRQPFFLQAIARGALRDRNWTRHTELLRVRRLVIAVAISPERANIEYALRALDPPTPRPASRRIFLARGPRYPRSLLNMTDLLPTLHDFGFEVADTAELSLAEQMALFATARLVVANHGAGLANLIFRIGQPLELVELFAPDCIHPQFAWVAHTFGFGYDALVGESATRSDSGASVSARSIGGLFPATGGSNFGIDPTEFRALITRAVARIDQAPRES